MALYFILFLMFLLCIFSLNSLLFDNAVFRILSFSFFSVILVLLYMVLNSPDVALTEASIGVFLSTILYLMCSNFIENSSSQTAAIVHKATNQSQIFYLIAFVMFCCFVFIFAKLAHFLGQIGLISNSLNFASYSYYVQNSVGDTGVLNSVTSIITSYRGFDTMGETAVIFLAAIGVFSICSTSIEEE